MKASTIFSRSLMAVALTGAFAFGALAQNTTTPASTPKQRDLRKNKKPVLQDKKEIAEDKSAVRTDHVTVRNDRKVVARNQAQAQTAAVRLSEDKKTFGANSPQVKQDQANMRSLLTARYGTAQELSNAKKDTRTDVRDVRQDKVEIQQDKRDLRQDKRATKPAVKPASTKAVAAK
jgi:hypothetical protein